MTSRPAPQRYPILYVDDESGNLSVFRHTFGDEFSVLTAQSGPEALALLSRERVAVLLADQRMPELTGVALAERVRELYPEVVRMIVTAYSDGAAVIDAINRGQVSRYITKPWQPQALAASLREAIEVYALREEVSALQRSVVESERLAVLGFLSAGVAHDLRSPMSCLFSLLEELGRSLGELERAAGQVPGVAETLHGLREALEDGRGAERQIRGLLDSMRAQVRPHTLGPLDVGAVVESALRLCRAEVATRAGLVLEREDVPRVRADAGQLGQVILNLVVNAAQALPLDAGRQHLVTVRVGTRAGQALIQVSDTGRGIPPDVLPRIFEPFFTTRAETGGTGLGLAIVKDAVRTLGGTIEVESALDKGTCFTVLLPAAP